MYAGSFVALFACHQLWQQILISLFLGFVIPICFVIGHDACHGSLTPHARLNQILGRLAFLPSLHPYTGWEWSHNIKHHGFTNVRGDDIVYVPFSPCEFARLPKWRQLAERAYRSAAGMGLLYFCSVFLPYEMFPSKNAMPPNKKARSYQIDRAFVVFFLLAQLWFLARSGHIIFGFLIPQAIFHYVMGFVTFLHHTHPKVPWYSDRREYSYYRSQVCSTTHIEFPRLMDFVLHRILQHTAHHVDPHIPLYHLMGAQQSLEKHFDTIIHEPFTMSGFFKTLRTCRLYDFDEHRWTDFNGKPTSDVLLQTESQSLVAAGAD